MSSNSKKSFLCAMKCQTLEKSSHTWACGSAETTPRSALKWISLGTSGLSLIALAWQTPILTLHHSLQVPMRTLSKTLHKQHRQKLNTFKASSAACCMCKLALGQIFPLLYHVWCSMQQILYHNIYALQLMSCPIYWELPTSACAMMAPMALASMAILIPVWVTRLMTTTLPLAMYICL